ncbi:leucine carboxyl methyltransferase [Colletotrichum musicola]|uniref:tRNA wybutosine-synthesizing protein 4 n=1 Tax=Colletotrichum musicola TaxID=2175873 RepID=A0A8H6JMP6_9PEZI|nr:leucine carboxyl methyltransferase [Colletotrichum musicola]
MVPSARARRAQASDELIMATNSSSIVSKRSVERLYYPDETHYFRFFVKKFQRRAPLINRGYHLRLKVIDTLVRRFLQKPSALKKVIVNLGCGSDVLPWQCEVRYPDACKDVTFIDVDYPDLIQKKRRIVVETPELRGILGRWEASDDSPIVLRSQKYCQVGCDLRQLSTLQSCLAQIFDMSSTEFFFVAEVSITYMDTEGADGVIKWAGAIENAEFCLLEQILPDGPDHPFAHTMLKHFNKLNTPLKSVHRYPSVASQEDRFQTLGWPSVESWTLWEAWADDFFMTSAERQALDVVEPFDEWEEFALFSSHYLVILATNPRRDGGHLSQKPEDLGIRGCRVPMELAEYASSRGYRRFGTAMLTHNPDGQNFISHNLGQGPNGRLNSEDLYQIPGQYSPPGTPRSGPSGRVCHTVTDLGDAGVLLVGGRSSPSVAFKDCWLHKKVFNRWERVQDLPFSLFRHSVTRLGSSSLALLAGGRLNHFQTSPDYLLFNPTKGWIKCKSQTLPNSLYGAVFTCTTEIGISRFGGLLAGGLLENGLVNQSTYRWTLDVSGLEPLLSFQRIEIQSEKSGKILLSRFGSMVIQIKEYTLLFGGVIRNVQLPASNDIVVLKSTHDRPEIIATLEGTGSSGTMRPFMIGSSVISYADSRIAIFGGGATCFSMGTCWAAGSYSLAFDPDSLSKEGGIRITPPGIEPVKYSETVEITSGATKSPVETSAPVVSQPIPRIRVDSKDQFHGILAEGKPVVIKGADVGSCTSTWSPRYLIDNIGANREVSVHESLSRRMDFNAKNFRYVNKKFGDFMKEVQDGKSLYLRALSTDNPSSMPTQLAQDYPSLSKDFCLPQQLEYAAQNTFSSVLRISGPVTMWLHYDVMANVYVQVKGSKRFVLFPPSDVTELRFAPGASSSSVDVFASLDSGSLSAVHPYEVNVQPGDILFLPPLWLHTAAPTTTDTSVAVNIFFRSLEKGYSLGRDVYGNRDLAAYEKGRQDIARIESSFSSLPPDARDFYIRRLADELLESVANV